MIAINLHKMSIFSISIVEENIQENFKTIRDTSKLSKLMTRLSQVRRRVFNTRRYSLNTRTCMNQLSFPPSFLFFFLSPRSFNKVALNKLVSQTELRNERRATHPLRMIL